MVPRPPPRPIRACLFDMDGLLINTEDLITTSINTILHKYDKPPIPGHIRAEIQGLHLTEASEIILRYSGLPLTFEEYQVQLAEQHARLFPTAHPLPGVVTLLQDLTRSEQVELALATSSGRGKFELKTGHLQGMFSQHFPEECRVLGDDPRLGSGKGKPEPDIYLLALDAVNAKSSRQGQAPILPEQCLVLEDAIAGVESGRRAGMQVLWCPHADILRSCQGIEEHVLMGTAGGVESSHDSLVDVARSEEDVTSSHSRWSEDRWARMLSTLEHFPYDDYGIKV